MISICGFEGICSLIINATVAQLVEYDLAKVGVAGSSPVCRSLKSLYLQRFFVLWNICDIVRTTERNKILFPLSQSLGEGGIYFYYELSCWILLL